MVVKDVPALVCAMCGNALIAAKEVKRLRNILKQAVAQDVELQSRRYQPLREGTVGRTVSAGEPKL